jgi:hypothetical protein
MGTKKDQDAAARRAEIWERIEEGWGVLKRLPDKERNALRNAERGSAWPMIVHSADEHAAWEKVPARRPPPGAAQISRMDEVLEWLLVLAKQDRKYFKAVILFCGYRKGPAEVAKLLGCHRETATVWRDNGLDRIDQHCRVKPVETKDLTSSLMQGMLHPMRAAG